MEITKRLKKIADCVLYRTMCDIGTDHGFLPVYLAQCGKIDYSAACDINKEPLLRAVSNIQKAGLSSVIDTRLGSGLSVVKRNEFETCVIAGMGGMLICDIIRDNLEIAWGFQQIILSPHLDISTVRRFLHENEFKIKKEFIFIDMGKCYTIIDCCKGVDVTYSEFDYSFGRFLSNNRSPELVQFFECEIAKNEHLIHIIKEAAGSNTANTRIAKLQHEIKLYKEAVMCLSQ